MIVDDERNLQIWYDDLFINAIDVFVSKLHAGNTEGLSHLTHHISLVFFFHHNLHTAASLTWLHRATDSQSPGAGEILRRLGRPPQGTRGT